MIKGIQKNMVVLKDPGGQLFEEVYFILRNRKPAGNLGKQDIAADINRIMEENFLAQNGDSFSVARKKRKRHILTFLAGMFVGGAVMLLVLLLFLFFSGRC